MRGVVGHGSEVRAVGRRLLLALPLGLSLFLLHGGASLADGPTIESAGGAYGYYWSPASIEVSPGGSVNFHSASGSVPHGVTWTGGPEKPSCSGVPIDEGKTSWSGSCSFTQAGTYSFYCPVHPTEMKGTIVATAGGAPPTGSPPPSGPAAAGAVASDLTLARRQRGATLRGSIQLLRAGPGSRLVVELTTRRARLLGPGHSGTMRVGRLVRSSPASGRFPLAVSLTPVARGALHDELALPVTVMVTVTSPEGDVFKRTRGVLMGNGAAPVRQAR